MSALEEGRGEVGVQRGEGAGCARRTGFAAGGAERSRG